MTNYRQGRTISFLTLNAPGERAHSRWGLRGRSSGVPCSCHELTRDGLAAWNVTAGHRWHVLMTSLRRAYPDLQYLRAVEPQQRGAMHLHVMLATWGGVDPEVVQAIALRVGFGCVMDLKPLDLADDDDTSARLASSYLSKYVTKSADGRHDVAWEGPHPLTGELVPVRARYRTWSASRGWGVQMKTVVAAIRRSSQVAAERLAGPPDPVELEVPGQTSLTLETSGAPPPGGG